MTPGGAKPVPTVSCARGGWSIGNVPRNIKPEPPFGKPQIRVSVGVESAIDDNLITCVVFPCRSEKWKLIPLRVSHLPSVEGWWRSRSGIH